MKKYLTIYDISAYQIAYNLSNYIWNIVIKWDFFTKKTIGEQFVRAVDSISANIAEGFGRYSKKDKILFYRYSYGSLQESIDWFNKASTRTLLKENEMLHIKQELDKIPKELHGLIKFTNEKLAI